MSNTQHILSFLQERLDILTTQPTYTTTDIRFQMRRRARLTHPRAVLRSLNKTFFANLTRVHVPHLYHPRTDFFLPSATSRSPRTLNPVPTTCFIPSRHAHTHSTHGRHVFLGELVRGVRYEKTRLPHRAVSNHNALDRLHD